jgi:hypothetical protein
VRFLTSSETSDILSCDDVRRLYPKVAEIDGELSGCCDTCHSFYPMYDMSLIRLGESWAWICDHVRWAYVSGEWRRSQEKGNTAEEKLLRAIFGEV